MTQTKIDAFPLLWPAGYSRSKSRINSPFKQTGEAAQRFLSNEIRLLGGTNVILSTNIPVRLDGFLYAKQMENIIPDPGVAVYFTWKGKSICMCCDRYRRVWENISALGRGIEALRGMDRWGVSDFLDKAFTGFTALPQSTKENLSCWDILKIPKNSSESQIRSAYRELSKMSHPDKGGSSEEFHRISKALNEALKQA